MEQVSKCLPTDLVVINVEHLERLRLAFEALDLLDLVVKEVELPERRQLGQALNLLDLVEGEIKLDQFCAPTEAFDGRDLIANQRDRLDKHPGFIEPLDLGDALVYEVDFIRLTIILLVVAHLHCIGTRVLIFSSGPILVEEVGMEQPQF